MRTGPNPTWLMSAAQEKTQTPGQHEESFLQEQFSPCHSELFSSMVNLPHLLCHGRLGGAHLSVPEASTPGHARHSSVLSFAITHNTSLCHPPKQQRRTDTRKWAMRRWRWGLELCCHKPKSARDHQKLKEASRDPPLEAGGAWPCQHLDLGLLDARTVKQ